MPKISDTEVPSYRHHKQSGQAMVTLNGRDILLGKYGTRESRDKYNRVTAEWLAAGRRLPAAPREITVAEIVVAFRKHARTYYRHADGTPTSEVNNYDQSVAPMLKLYAKLPAAEFGPLRLKATIAAMIQIGWCRSNINKHVGRLKHLFKWATENEMIGPNVYHALQAVSGLRAGRSDAPEPDPVKPVPHHVLDATLPCLSRTVRAMVEVQLLTGARPGEVCAMRTADIDTTGKVWLCKPAEHKTAHHGHERIVYIGPRAQRVLQLFLKHNLGAFIFSPAEAEAERLADLHARRKTPLSCGNRPGTNRRGKPKQTPGACYDVDAYRRAITRACDRADEWAKGGVVIGNDERLVPRWHPHQLRHTAATELRKEYGLEAAQVILGHRTLTVTQVYAEKNVEAAMTIMAAVG